MQKGLIRKGLVFSVIALFIGVGIQPVFAGESITSTLDNDEDCIECQVSDGFSLLRAKILLFRVKAITTIILSSELVEIPEVKEKCEEILDIINSNILLNPPILECAILLIQHFTYFAVGFYCNVLIPNFTYQIFPNFTLWLQAFGYNMLEKSDEYWDIAKDLDCWWTNLGPPRLSIQV